MTTTETLIIQDNEYLYKFDDVDDAMFFTLQTKTGEIISLINITKFNDNNFLYIDSVTTSDDYLQQGFATILFNKMIETVFNYPYTRIELDVIPIFDYDAGWLTEWYKKFGFREPLINKSGTLLELPLM